MSAPAQANPLEQLRDIHLPDPVSLWPLAPGWWLLAASTLIAIATIVFFFVRHRRRNAYRRAALAILNDIESLRVNGDHSLYLQQLNQLLKQTALVMDDSKNISGLSGKQWLQFLDSSGNTTGFSTGAGSILADGQYRPAVAADDLTALQQLAARWIREHRPPC
jgi:hypothetical protein